ncbi:MAG: TonB-dependent receptor plug domain-containing protein [Pseudohongiellaceae bacterium]
MKILLKILSRTRYYLTLALATVVAMGGLALGGGIAVAQEPQGAEALEEIIVTGSRARPRTVSDSPVPVDVFNFEAIESVAHPDTNNILQTLVPSYNVSRSPISDGTTFIRAPTLRGLPTDKTLVLINSKRRHRSSLVAIGGFGTQGPDVATIPSTAIQSVEVLRDGAAAQYGSDAIAGVINFLLKTNNEGGSLSIDTGQYSEGDGSTTTVSGNIGLPLGADGFLSISAQVTTSDATERGEQYCESWFCVNPNLPGYDGTADYTVYTEDPAFQAGVPAANIGFGDVVQPWGQPDRDASSVFFNAGIPMSGDTELYGYGNYSTSETNGSFFYRYPENGTIERVRQADGSIYFPLEKYPGGFTPRFFGDLSDFSIVGGWRGTLSNGLNYDFSARTGENMIEYTLSNTINPSLGTDSPTSFRPGDLVNTETQFQADFTYEMNSDSTVGPLLFAFGVSYMDESYEVVEGEPKSYEQGPYANPDPHNFCADPTTAGDLSTSVPTAAGMALAANLGLDCTDADDPVYTAVGVGSNGFPGYSPDFSELFERSSYALYGDVSADVTDNLFLQGALRYENYDDFDAELVWKVAGKLTVTDTFGIRGSIGTGFRAPTPGQQGTINVSTRLPNGFPVATGLFPANGPVAAALGATALKPETSTNFTLGITAEIGQMDLTLDLYRIDIDDRTRAISTRDVSSVRDPDIEDEADDDAYQNFVKLRDAGVPGANTIGGVFYFTNAFDTRNQGMDLVATMPVDWGGNMGTTTLTGSLNYNSIEFLTDPSSVLNAENRHDFENFAPKWRGVFTGRHNVNALTFVVRFSYYGEATNANTGGSPLRYQTYGATWFTDLEAQYDLNDNVKFTLGGRNVFDAYPDKDSISDYCCGRLYSSATSVDWQGAYYYGRANFSF